MVYINSLNAFIGIGLIILLATFIIYVAYLWLENIQTQAEQDIRETVDRSGCFCFEEISDNGDLLLLINGGCDYIENFRLQHGSEIFNSQDTLYRNDLFLANYSVQSDFYVLMYNNCTEFFNK